MRDYGYQHFSAGDLLRAEVASGSELGKECETLMKEGKLVPMEITIKLLKDAMLKSENKKFLIDGFPRALDQAVAFEDSVMPCSYILYFDCPLATMEARLLKRGETSGRSDDNAETIMKRFDTFMSQSLPVITHYEKLGKVFKISSVPAPDEVYIKVKSVFTLDPSKHAPHTEAQLEVRCFGRAPCFEGAFVLGGQRRAVRPGPIRGEGRGGLPLSTRPKRNLLWGG